MHCTALQPQPLFTSIGAFPACLPACTHTCTWPPGRLQVLEIDAPAEQLLAESEVMLTDM